MTAQGLLEEYYNVVWAEGDLGVDEAATSRPASAPAGSSRTWTSTSRTCA